MIEPRNVKVSIGMPVYNGGDEICKALDSLLSQTYSNYELIISDNASTDDTKEICQQYSQNDSRIRYIRNNENQGPIKNFEYVLIQSTGEYFMWAAHDDVWDKRFIELAVEELDWSNKTTVAVGCEAQYTINKVKQPFFHEGKAFYDKEFSSDFDRIIYVLKYSYGNMFYSLYRREALFKDGQTYYSMFSHVSLNEIPLFIFVASKGNWKILPEVLFYKETNIATYIQARWEVIGGVLVFGGVRRFLSSIVYGVKYHLLAYIDITRSIRNLEIPITSRIKLYCWSCALLISHFFLSLFHYKKKRKVMKYGDGCE